MELHMSLDSLILIQLPDITPERPDNITRYLTKPLGLLSIKIMCFNVEKYDPLSERFKASLI